MNFKLAVVVVIVVGAAVAFAQEITANQGNPGVRGPWPIRAVGGVGDGGAMQTTPVRCSTTIRDGGNPDQVTSVGVTSTAVPATTDVSRVWVLVCNSIENTGVPKVKCLTNGGTPVMGIANSGMVLGVGDCFQYTTASALNCISDTAATAVLSYECR